MKVKELVKLLEGCNPELPVMIDNTLPDADIFHFIGIKECQQVEAEGKKIIVLTTCYSSLNTEERWS